MVTEALLEGSLKGVGKFHKTPIFPCGIFQYKQGVNDKPGTPNYDLKKLAIKSTVRRLYPNYANCDWSVNDSAINYDRVTKREIIRNIRDNDKDTYDKLVKFFTEHYDICKYLRLELVDSGTEIGIIDEVQPDEDMGTINNPVA